MKKLLLSVMLSALALMAFAQQAPNAIDKAMQDQIKKDKEKSDKDITNDKLKSKAKTWQDRAKAYEQVALQYMQLDSNAALTAYEAYQQVVALDKDKNGGPGKMAQETQKLLTEGGASDLYRALLSTGAAKYQAKNYEGAVQFMEKALAVHPKDTTAAMYTGIAAQQGGKSDVARSAFAKYIELGGKDPVIYYSLANSYRQENNVDKAIEILDKGIAANPGYKDLSNEKVNILLGSGRLDKAITELKQLVEKDPNNVQNLFNLGLLHDNAARQFGDELQKLGAQGRKSGDAKKKLEEATTKEQTYAQEITRLTTRLKSQPKNSELTRQLNEAKKMQAEAKADVQRLTAEASQAGTTAGTDDNKVVELTAKQAEQMNLAKGYYQQVLKLEPNNYDANFSMGVVYFNEAVETKRQVDGMDMKTYQEKGKAVEQQLVTKFKEAMPFFEKAYEIKQEPDLKENLRNLYNVLKQYEKTDAYDAKLQKVSE
jgi:tetratricopeptide (TPR) repeat protein